MTAPEPTLRDALAELANNAQRHIDLDAIDDYQRGWRQAHRKFKRDLDELLAAHPVPEPTAITMQSDAHNPHPSEGGVIHVPEGQGWAVGDALIADAQRSEVRLTEDAGPECDNCGKTTCPDADQPAFTEPTDCEFASLYRAFRDTKDCDYGCGRDYSMQAVRLWMVPEFERILAARLAEVTAERNALRAQVEAIADRPTVDALLACLPMSDDGTGHVADCGYDEDATPTCGCFTLRSRFAQVLAARDAEVRQEAETRWMKVAVMKDGEAIREAQEVAFDEGVAAGQEWGRRVNAPYPHNPYRDRAWGLRDGSAES